MIPAQRPPEPPKRIIEGEELEQRRLSAGMDPAGAQEQRNRRGREQLAYQQRLALEQREAEVQRYMRRRYDEAGRR